MNSEIINRYTPGQQLEIFKFLKLLAERTRKSRRISQSRIDNIIKAWERYDTDVVMEAIGIFVNIKTTAAQNEKYVIGIMRNKQREKEASLNGRHRKNNSKDESGGRKNGTGNEGERLQQFATIKSADLSCDF